MRGLLKALLFFVAVGVLVRLLGDVVLWAGGAGLLPASVLLQVLFGP